MLRWTCGKVVEQAARNRPVAHLRIGELREHACKRSANHHVLQFICNALFKLKLSDLQQHARSEPRAGLCQHISSTLEPIDDCSHNVPLASSCQQYFTLCKRCKEQCCTKRGFDLTVGKLVLPVSGNDLPCMLCCLMLIAVMLSSQLLSFCLC